MKKHLLLTCGLLSSALLALAVWVFLDWSPSVAVKDVCQAETLVIGKKTGNNTITGFRISGTGEIDGEAAISLLLGGEPYRVEKLSGKVEFKWGGDWYADTARIRYEPVNVRSGKVVLRYEFY
jgi:hypothetical protein